MHEASEKWILSWAKYQGRKKKRRDTARLVEDQDKTKYYKEKYYKDSESRNNEWINSEIAWYSLSKHCRLFDLQ